MSPVKRLLVGLGLLLGVLTGVAFALPEHISVARATVIEAPESDVFAYVNDTRRLLEWSSWAPREAGTTYQLSGPEGGVGAGLAWRSERTGGWSGRGEIVASEPNAMVEIAIACSRLGRARAIYRLTPAGAGTRITSSLDVGGGSNPVERWRGLLRARSLGTEMEASLARLKRIVETDG